MDHIDAKWFARRLQKRGAPRLADAFLVAFDAATTGQIAYSCGHWWLEPYDSPARKGIDAFGSTADGAEVFPWVAK